jgi:hemerythrin-like domain-containing protein
MLHHHHHIEETLLFPFFETKLGLHTMDHNVEQHHAFMAGLDDLEAYLKGVQSGTETYNGTTIIQKLDSFADTLVEHLRDVCISFPPEIVR